MQFRVVYDAGKRRGICYFGDREEAKRWARKLHYRYDPYLQELRDGRWEVRKI